MANVAAGNPNGFKTLLPNDLSRFIKGNPVYSKDPKGLPKNLLDCPFLCN